MQSPSVFRAGDLAAQAIAVDEMLARLDSEYAQHAPPGNQVPAAFVVWTIAPTSGAGNLLRERRRPAWARTNATSIKPGAVITWSDWVR